MKEKIQKILQDIGFDSRRKIRSFIHQGKFKVNGRKVSDPNLLVDPAKEEIHFEMKKIDIKRQKKSYFILNKPAGVVSTLADPQKRSTIADYITQIKERVYPVGRLDYVSEGLILLTNDGELANFILSPRNQIPKIYLIKIKGILPEEKRLKLQQEGFSLDKSRIRLGGIKFIKKTKAENSWWQVTLFEGKKHILRRIFKYAGYPVEKLKRIAIGTIHLKKLPPGHWRELTQEEISRFQKKYIF